MDTDPRLQRRREYNREYRRRRATAETPQEKETRLECRRQRDRERRAAQRRVSQHGDPEEREALLGKSLCTDILPARSQTIVVG